MDRRSSLRLIGGSVAGATVGSIWGSARAARPDNRPDIIVVVVDDLRWDEYGSGGHPYLKTPNIDRLAVDRASFTRAFHATPIFHATLRFNTDHRGAARKHDRS